MRYTRVPFFKRITTWLATLAVPPYYGRVYLANLFAHGYISRLATIHHSALNCGSNVFIDDGVLIYQDTDGGPVKLSDGVHVHRETILQNGKGGDITIGPHTHIQPRCIFSAYHGSINIGSHVEIAAYCTFYSYNHGFRNNQLIRRQQLQSKGPICIGDDVWLGVGTVVLDGVTIGRGAVIGAGAVVTSNIPELTIAAGVPAKIIGTRPYQQSQRVSTLLKEANVPENPTSS